jgi:hypothetical protein
MSHGRLGAANCNHKDRPPSCHVVSQTIHTFPIFTSHIGDQDKDTRLISPSHNRIRDRQLRCRVVP